MTSEILVQSALASGATKAAPIDVASIVLSASFRDICRSNGCGLYGRCWVCPPEIGEIDELMAQVRSYEHALLYQTIHEIEDSFDFEGMMEAGTRHAQTSLQLEKALGDQLGKHLHLSCGGCHLCERCAKADNEPCRHPDQALPSMEGYGIDVYTTVKATDLKYINGANTVTYFGIVLY